MAADLLAQSEHDVAAVPILVATSEDFVAAVDMAAAVLMHSETYVLVSKDSLADPVRRAEFDRFVLLLKSAPDGRDRA